MGKNFIYVGMKILVMRTHDACYYFNGFHTGNRNGA